MSKPLFFLFLIIILISMVKAVPIENTTFNVNDYLSEGMSEIVYEITPEADTIITLTLTGSNGYAPVLKVFVEDEEVTFLTAEAARGKTATLSFLSRGEKTSEITYRIVLDVMEGVAGANYAFTYEAKTQNDAGSGTDAPETFDDSLLLTTGTYEGFLGGEDTADFYSLNLQQDETVTFTLTAQKKGSLGLTLIDGEMFKKIAMSSYLDPLLDDATLTTSFFSLSEQHVKININGNTKYTLLIESDAVVAEEEVLPPPRPLPPIEVPEIITIEEEIISTSTPEEESTLPYIIGAGIVVLIVLGLLYWKANKKKN